MFTFIHSHAFIHNNSKNKQKERLLPAYLDWLADVPDDPFETALVIVPNVGVRDWLTAELGARLGSTGHGDGVVANIRFSFTDWLNAEALDLTDQLRGHRSPSSGPRPARSARRDNPPSKSPTSV